MQLAVDECGEQLGSFHWIDGYEANQKAQVEAEERYGKRPAVRPQITLLTVQLCRDGGVLPYGSLAGNLSLSALAPALGSGKTNCHWEARTL